MVLDRALNIDVNNDLMAVLDPAEEREGQMAQVNLKKKNADIIVKRKQITLFAGMHGCPPWAIWSKSSCCWTFGARRRNATSTVYTVEKSKTMEK